ncbi:hypothetical protein Q5P01_013913 [Channa striata]|uniref:Uncharacterized protein n=1 Tax=Channa striata TaxID=64152 RepID=A0AA88MK48_CHASR|nr:hypothetical protein Q5P01_013913 [Channa striata]
MPLANHELPQKLFSLLKSAVNVFLLIVLFYTLQYIFDMEFVCSCKPGLHNNGVLYMVAPPLILTFVVSIIEPFPQERILTGRRFALCSQPLKFFIRLITMSAVWVSTVLFDGDWYFCLMTNLNMNQTGLPCRKDLDYDEQRIKDAYKTTSLDIGFGVICSFLFFWNISDWCGSICRRMKVSEAGFQSKKDLCLPYYRTVYNNHLEEEMRSYVNEKLKYIAAERVKAICEPHLQAIQNQELSRNNKENDNGNNTVSKDWWIISAFDFHQMEIPGTRGIMHQIRDVCLIRKLGERMQRICKPH